MPILHRIVSVFIFTLLLLLLLLIVSSSISASLSSDIQLHSAERLSPSQFAVYKSSTRHAKTLGTIEDSITRTEGTNCKQTPSSSHSCDLCCDGKCCEDSQFWNANRTLENAQLWIPVRVLYIIPVLTHSNVLPSDSSVKTLFGQVNQAFAQFPFRFLFNSSSFVKNDTLISSCPTDDCYTDPNCGFFNNVLPTAAQRNDHEIVLIVCHGISYLGEAQFPWGAPQYQYIQLQLSNFLGAAIAHELGHNVGLMHVFQGACDSKGDWVSDTAPATTASGTCGSVRDSCPGHAGNDDTRNFMNYGIAWNCGMGFTAGQIERATRTMEQYRPSLIANTRVSLNESNSNFGNESSSVTRMPGCAIEAKTFADCWCENDRLDPATWCQSLAPPGVTFTTAVTLSPATTPAPANAASSAVKMMWIYGTSMTLMFVFFVGNLQ